MVFSVHANIELINMTSKFCLGMSLLLKIALFAPKCIVFYGVASIFHEIVGIKTTPLPRCVSNIQINSEVWKHFDTGLYEFIKKLARLNKSIQLDSLSHSTCKFFLAIFTYQWEEIESVKYAK